MKNLLVLASFVTILLSCSLSADQEAALNSSLARYMKARNECQVVGLVGFTYPELVRDYKSAGDSVFQHKFDCDKNVEYYNIIQNATLRSTSKENKSIHVLYDFDEFNEEDGKISKRTFELVAISENDGINWFFIPWKDYFDKNRCKKLKRLITK